MGDVEEAVLRQRGRFKVFVRRGTADRDRASQLEVLAVLLVDLARPPYTPEFSRQMVEMVCAGRSASPLRKRCWQLPVWLTR
jgi:hypothetical protein